jgi:hypothetical protein
MITKEYKASTLLSLNYMLLEEHGSVREFYVVFEDEEGFNLGDLYDATNQY